MFNGNFRTNRLHRAIGAWNILHRAVGQDRYRTKQWNNTLNQDNHKRSSAWALWRQSLPQRSLSSQSLGKYRQLNQNNRKTEHIPMQNNHTQKGALINSNTLKKTYAKKQNKTEPGLVTFYYIRPEYGACLFLTTPKHARGLWRKPVWGISTGWVPLSGTQPTVSNHCTGCPLFFNIDFPWLFHDQKWKSMTHRHNMYFQVNDMTYECIPELVVTVPSARSTIVKKIKRFIIWLYEWSCVTFTELLSAVVKIPWHHHFPWLSMTFAVFHDFPGLENGLLKFSMSFHD